MCLFLSGDTGLQDTGEWKGLWLWDVGARRPVLCPLQILKALTPPQSLLWRPALCVLGPSSCKGILPFTCLCLSRHRTPRAT